MKHLMCNDEFDVGTWSNVMSVNGFHCMMCLLCFLWATQINLID